MLRSASAELPPHPDLRWRTADEPLGRLSELAPAELRVLRLMADGSSNAAIAERLVISLRTVESHISRILIKLDLRQGEDLHRRVAAVLVYLAESGGRSPGADPRPRKRRSAALPNGGQRRGGRGDGERELRKTGLAH